MTVETKIRLLEIVAHLLTAIACFVLAWIILILLKNYI